MEDKCVLFAESFDTCRISYIRYGMNEMSILCFKLVWWDVSKWLSHDSFVLLTWDMQMLILMASDWSTAEKIDKKTLKYERILQS